MDNACAKSQSLTKLISFAIFGDTVASLTIIGDIILIRPDLSDE